MLSQQPSYSNRDIVRRIHESCTVHPTYSPPKETGCMVMDDDQWKVYKKTIASIAKERRQPKVDKTAVFKKKIRNQRDENFETIPYDANRILRICTDTFAICRTKVEDIHEPTTYVNDVIKCLRGDIDTFDCYFWTTY